MVKKHVFVREADNKIISSLPAACTLF